MEVKDLIPTWNSDILSVVLLPVAKKCHLQQYVLVFICILPLNKTDLQTSSQRLNLSGTANMPVAKLDPDESFDQVIQHEVKELGTHM